MAKPRAFEDRQPAFRLFPWMPVLAFGFPALLLSLYLLSRQTPDLGGFLMLAVMPGSQIDHLIIFYSFLPRLVMALLCGAALGLSGTMFQQVLRNPLAEPTTLGVSAGASLAMIFANLWFPRALGEGQEVVALFGAMIGCLLVFLIARRQRFSSAALIMAGLVVSLYCASLASLAVLYNYQYLDTLFLWEAGSLYQNSWNGVLYLSPRLLAAGLLAVVFLRPITMLSLGDATARSAGLNAASSRIAVLILAALLGGFVASTVGMIGFIGLAAPNLVRMCSARTSRQQLLWSPLLGATLLWLADGIVQVIGTSGNELPTGVLTAFIGAPFLLFLIAQSKQTLAGNEPLEDGERTSSPSQIIGCAGCILAILGVIAVTVGRDTGGWTVTLPLFDIHAVLQWRWPRVLAAASAGALLSIAGGVLQRLTGNPIASPEILGMTSGATVGYMVQIILLPYGVSQAFGFAGAAAGAGIALFALLSMNILTGGGSDRTLLVGVAITTLCSALMTALLATGHPALRSLLGWVQGTTAGVSAKTSLLSLTAVLLSTILLPALIRWIRVLPLGRPIALSLGVPNHRAQFFLLTFCAAITGVASLLIGPLTFVGLMAPHIAWRLGLRGAGVHIVGAALIGASLLAVSDWLGRMLLFPWEIPAGLVSTFIGGPYFMWLMQRRSR